MRLRVARYWSDAARLNSEGGFNDFAIGFTLSKSPMVSLSQDVSPPTMTLLDALRETLDGGFTDEDVKELVPRWTQAAPGGSLPRPEASYKRLDELRGKFRLER